MAPAFACPFAADPFNFPTEPHDIGMEDRHGQVIAKVGKGQEPRQSLGVRQGAGSFREPLVLVGCTRIHTIGLPPRRGPILA